MQNITHCSLMEARKERGGFNGLKELSGIDLL
jgi:hypothetical protein